jgi:hypothetical protein
MARITGPKPRHCSDAEWAVILLSAHIHHQLLFCSEDGFEEVLAGRQRQSLFFPTEVPGPHSFDECCEQAFVPEQRLITVAEME